MELYNKLVFDKALRDFAVKIKKKPSIWTRFVAVLKFISSQFTSEYRCRNCLSVDLYDTKIDGHMCLKCRHYEAIRNWPRTGKKVDCYSWSVNEELVKTTERIQWHFLGFKLHDKTQVKILNKELHDEYIN